MLSSSKRPIVIFTILLIIVVAMILHLIHEREARLLDRTITVTARPVLRKNIVIYLYSIGTVEPYSSVAIKSLVTGQLLALNFQEGDEVKQDQVLFHIDPKPYQAALDQAKANLARDEAQLNNAQVTLNRNTALEKKGYVSQQDYDAAQATVLGLTATVQADAAAVATAELQLGYCEITSPITGRTGTVQVDPGNVVKENDSTPLVTINQLTPIYVIFAVPEQHLPELRQQFKKGNVPISVSFKQKTLSGRLSFIDNTVNVDTGTIQLKATFPNEDEVLWPGQFVKVKVPVEHLTDALVIPTLAVQTGQQGAYVYVMKDNKAHIRQVTLGPMEGNETVILKGLSEGEQVITEGILRLQEGSPVRLPGDPTHSVLTYSSRHAHF